MTTATVTFTNSDNSNSIVLTIASANPPIIEVTVGSAHPYTTQALELNQTYSLQLRKQGVVKSFILTVTSNPFGCDLNDLFNGTTPTPAKVTFINSDPSNAVTLSVKDDQGNTVVDDVSVTNSDPYVIDTLKLDATYSVHLEREGASKRDISLPITSSPFTYDVYTPFLNDAIVIFTNSDKSRSITLSVLDDEGVPVVSDVVVRPGSNPYITTLQLKETYKILLVKGTTQAESSVTISSNPFSYDVDTPFYVQVTFINSNQLNAVSLSVPDGKGGYLIQDVSVTNIQPYVTDVLDLNQTYTLKLTKGNESTELSLTITSNPFTYDVDTPFSNNATVTFANSDESRSIRLSILDDEGVPVVSDVVVSPGSNPYITTLRLKETYKLLLVRGTVRTESSVTISSDPFFYDVNKPFEVQVTFTNSDPSNAISLSVPDGKGGYLIQNVSVINNQPYVTGVLDLNQTYTLKLTKANESAQLSLEIKYNQHYVDVNTSFEGPVKITFTTTGVYGVSLSVLDGRGGYPIKDALISYFEPYATRVLNLNALYTLELKVIGYSLSAQPSITFNPNWLTYDVYTPFSAEVTFTNSHGQAYNVVFDVLYNNEKVGSTLGVDPGKSYTSNLLLRNVTYTLKSYWDTRQTTITITHTPFTYDVGAVFGAGQITNSDQ